MLRLWSTFASRRTGKHRNRVSPRLEQSWNASHGAVRALFVFAIADLWIAHLNHLHHTLASEHLAALGRFDALPAPIDGAYALRQADMVEVIEQPKPPLVIPMHHFDPSVPRRAFLPARAPAAPMCISTPGRKRRPAPDCRNRRKSWCCREIDGRLGRRCRGPAIGTRRWLPTSWAF
jgi:hypothetical protein